MPLHKVKSTSVHVVAVPVDPNELKLVAPAAFDKLYATEPLALREITALQLAPGVRKTHRDFQDQSEVGVMVRPRPSATPRRPRPCHICSAPVQHRHQAPR